MSSQNGKSYRHRRNNALVVSDGDSLFEKQNQVKLLISHLISFPPYCSFSRLLLFLNESKET